MNSLLNTITRYVRSLIVAKIICIVVYSISVLLCFNYKMTYWSSFVKEIFNLVRLISTNLAFFASTTMYINFLIFIISVQVTLKAVFILRFIIERGLSSMIFLKIFFVIGKRFYFLLENNLFSTFNDECYLWIIKAILT